ncbi:T9SS-dependent choice-of-anchor J family protein [Hymenobacter sp. IS2118]|uniref:T9SS-dependent choice-of-anchor J family protein n=1 Tax=Hymenobacter sp. IS2118 TaxID=1505605 RepID=UPI001378F056|nr:choice-of-anchor J domain-containing protein [Hymenobacter sp. IS2118]
MGVRGTIAFPALPATLLPGTNVVTVSVANDDNNANNSVTVGQLVTADRLSYIDPSKALETGGLSAGVVGGVLSVKYTVPNTVVLKDVSIEFDADPTNPTTAFRVLVYDATGTGATPGNLIYTSPRQNRPAAGGNVSVALPGLQRSGTFYIGVEELEAAGLALAVQEEVPLRAATFYYSGNGTAPWLDLATTTLPLRFAIEVGLAPAPACATPTALAVTATTATTATVSFADADNTGSYQIIYGPVGFQPATSGTTLTATTSPFTITGLQGGTTYQVYVRSNCTAGGTSFLTAPVNFSTSCNAVTTVATFPYRENFDALPPGQALPCGITVLNSNGDAATWAVSSTNANSGTRNIRYAGLTLNNVAADDWFFTPALELSASSRYQVAFRYRGEGITNSPSDFTESLEVTSGTAATVAAQTNVLYTNAAITNTSYALANGTSTPVVALLPAGAGTQFVGFHIKSLANQGNLYIDDIAITATAVTANSEALLRAISVFPNPSTTGLFDLEIHGAKAKGNLSVQVTNVLGQSVYTGSARDNYTNKLDLSSLAPGIYYLNVRTGAEYTTSRISIVK